MAQLNLSMLNSGPGYPIVTEVFGAEKLLLGLEMTLAMGAFATPTTPIVGLVRKWGLKNLAEAEAVLRRMLENTAVSAWILVINPKKGRDDQTAGLLLQAFDGLNPADKLRLTVACPLCVLHVEQPEGSPNSWTAGLSAGAAMLMMMFPREQWERIQMFFCSGETIIANEEMSKFTIPSALPLLTYRHSPPWLHPGVLAYNRDDHAETVQFMARALTMLQLAIASGQLETLTDRDIARLVPLWRNTGRCWRLSDLAKLGLFDRRCNVGQGMEDWLHVFLWIRYLSGSPEGLNPLSLAERVTRAPIVFYEDERMKEADAEPSKRADQIGKFEKEIIAWKERFTMFVEAGSESAVPLEHQEFRIPA